MKKYIKPELKLNDIITLECTSAFQFEEWEDEEGLFSGITTFGLKSSKN